MERTLIHVEQSSFTSFRGCQRPRQRVGCLLPEEIVSFNLSTTEPRKISSCLPPDAALWDPWFKHTLLLKDHHVLTTERLVQLFTPLLLPHNASYSTKAKVLLRTLLSRSSEECPSVEVARESSSCGLPSFSYDSAVEVRPVRPAQEHCRNARTTKW